VVSWVSAQVACPGQRVANRESSAGKQVGKVHRSKVQPIAGKVRASDMKRHALLDL